MTAGRWLQPLTTKMNDALHAPNHARESPDVSYRELQVAIAKLWKNASHQQLALGRELLVLEDCVQNAGSSHKSSRVWLGN